MLVLSHLQNADKPSQTLKKYEYACTSSNEPTVMQLQPVGTKGDLLNHESMKPLEVQMCRSALDGMRWATSPAELQIAAVEQIMRQK